MSKVKALKENYAKNVAIMKENIKRGMTARQVVSQVEMWRKQFERAGMLGDDEKDFLNACLELVEDETKITLKIM